ncbi:YbgC/FadM family acyl-CoA thioesterase [Bartonella sp. DGB2]|uniref:YbgC/FadM family acyl-CoA thioesterase n=1 Tax=Bartonella sp. DGB2 TaxID=3388426 RepID=UPI00398FAB1A
MKSHTPLEGVLRDGAHYLSARVYFADTDFTGVIYHARYLEFLERGRSDFLRLLGLHHQTLSCGVLGETAFWVVRRLGLDFKKPGHIDDILTIKTQLRKISGARVFMTQHITCQNTVLVEADVEAALINQAGAPQRLPTALVAKLAFQNPALTNH